MHLYRGGRFPSAEDVGRARPSSDANANNSSRGQSVEPQLIHRPTFGLLKKSVTFDSTHNHVPARLPRSLNTAKTTSSFDPVEDDHLPPPRKSAERPPRRSADKNRAEPKRPDDDEDNEREYHGVDSSGNSSDRDSPGRRRRQPSKPWARRGLFGRSAPSSSPERSYVTEGDDSGDDYENMIGVQSSSTNDRRMQEQAPGQPVSSAPVYNLADEVPTGRQRINMLQPQRTNWQAGPNYRRQSSLRPQQTMHHRPPSMAIPTQPTHGVYGSAASSARPSIFRSREEVSRMPNYEDPYSATERMPAMPNFPSNMMHMPPPTDFDEYGRSATGLVERTTAVEARRTASPRRLPQLRRAALERQSRTEEPEPGLLRPEDPTAVEAGKSVEDLNLRRRLTGQERLEQRRRMQREKKEKRILQKEKTRLAVEDELEREEQRNVRQEEVIARLERERDKLREDVRKLEREATDDEAVDEKEDSNLPSQRASLTKADLEAQRAEERRLRIETVKNMERRMEDEHRRLEAMYSDELNRLKEELHEKDVAYRKEKALREAAAQVLPRPTQPVTADEASDEDRGFGLMDDDPAAVVPPKRVEPPPPAIPSTAAPVAPPQTLRPTSRPSTPINQVTSPNAIPPPNVQVTPPSKLLPSPAAYSPTSPRFSPTSPAYSPAYSPVSATGRQSAKLNDSPRSQRSSASKPQQTSPIEAQTSAPQRRSRLNQVSPEVEDEPQAAEDEEEDDEIIVKEEDTSSVEGRRRTRLLSTPWPEREYTMDAPGVPPTGTAYFGRGYTTETASTGPRKPLDVFIRPPYRQGTQDTDATGATGDSYPDQGYARMPARPHRHDTIKTEATEDSADPRYMLPLDDRIARQVASPVWSSDEEGGYRDRVSGQRVRRSRSRSGAAYPPRLPYGGSTVNVDRRHFGPGYQQEPTFRAGTPPGGGYQYQPPGEVAEWFLPRHDQVDRYIIQPMLTRALGSHQGSWILARKVAEASTAGKARVVVKQLMSRKKLRATQRPFVVSFDEVYLKACLDSSADRKLATLMDVALRIKKKKSATAKRFATSGYSLIFVENCTHSIDILDRTFDLRKSIMGDDDDDFLTWVKGMEGLKKKGFFFSKGGSNSRLKSFTWEPFGFKDVSERFPKRVRRLQFTFEFYVPYRCPGRANCQRSDLRLVFDSSGSHSHVFIQRRSVLAQVSIPEGVLPPFAWAPSQDYTCIVVDRPTSLSPEEENVFFNTLDASRYRFRPSFQLSEATDKWYMGACLYFIIRDTLKSWETLISVAIDHVKSREDEVIQNPTHQQHTTNLWSDRSTWLELSTLLDSHISTIAQIRNFAVETFEIPAEAAEELFDDIYTRTDDIARSIEKQLQARTDNLVQFVFNYMNSHDTQISLEQGMISASTGTSMHRLSWVTFVFLPLTFLAGIFGMNVDQFSSPERMPIKWYFVSAAVMLFLVIIAVYVMKFWRRGFRAMNAVIRWCVTKSRKRRKRPMTEDIESWLLPEKKFMKTPRYAPPKSPLLNGAPIYPTLTLATIPREVLKAPIDSSLVVVEERPISPKGNSHIEVLPWMTLMQPGPEPIENPVDLTAPYELPEDTYVPPMPVTKVDLADVVVHLVIALGMSGYSVMCHATRHDKGAMIGFTSAVNFDRSLNEREYSRLIRYQQDQMSTHGWGDIDIKSIPRLASNLESALVKSFGSTPTDRIRRWPTINIYVVQRIFDDHHYAMRLSHLPRSSMPLKFKLIPRSDAIALGRVSLDRPVLVVSHVTPSRRNSYTKFNDKIKSGKTTMNLTWYPKVAEPLEDVDFTQVLMTFILDVFDERKLRIDDNTVDIEEIITKDDGKENKRTVYGRNRKVGWGTVILHDYAWLCLEGVTVPKGFIYMHQSEKTFQISLEQLQGCFDKYTAFIANFFRRQIKSVLVSSAKKPALLIEEGLLPDHTFPLNPTAAWSSVFSKLADVFERCIYSDGEDMMRNVLEHYSSMKTTEKVQILDQDLLNGRLVDHGTFKRVYVDGEERWDKIEGKGHGRMSSIKENENSGLSEEAEEKVGTVPEETANGKKEVDPNFDSANAKVSEPTIDTLAVDASAWEAEGGWEDDGAEEPDEGDKHESNDSNEVQESEIPK